MNDELKEVVEQIPTIPEWEHDEPSQALIKAAQSYLDVTPAILQGTPKSIVNRPEYWGFPWPNEDSWDPDIENPNRNLAKAAAYITVAMAKTKRELEEAADSLGEDLKELYKKKG